MMHLIDRFFACDSCELVITPVCLHLSVQKILVNRGQLSLKYLVQKCDYFFAALHRRTFLPEPNGAHWGRTGSSAYILYGCCEFYQSPGDPQIPLNELRFTRYHLNELTRACQSRLAQI